MTVQSPNPPRDPFFVPKRFASTFEICGRTYELVLGTPDLCALPTDTWGDWGPMHTCALPPDRFVTVTYRCAESGRGVTYRLNPPTVSINSPAPAQERARTPRYVEVEDPARGVQIRGYLDADGEPAHVVVEPLWPQVDFPALVFREADAARVSDDVTVGG